MNKTDRVEMMQKRTIQLTVILVVFVGMMIFLVPTLIEEAEAKIQGKAMAAGGGGNLFSNIVGKMSEGRFFEGPEDFRGVFITWTTLPIYPGGPEKGTIEANFGNLGKVTFSFNHPSSGPNTCEVTHGPGIIASCGISDGSNANVSFLVYRGSGNNNNNFCDILPKIGGLDQLKIIREKLDC